MNNLGEMMNGTHSAIVEIPLGFGFSEAANYLGLPEAEADILEISPTLHDSQKTPTINAEDINDLQIKTRSKNARQQFYVFHDAEKMTEPAQNKFLKLLEEPRDGVRFILLVNSAENLLDTVRSRAQKGKIAPISQLESVAILKKFKLDEAKTRQILFLATGLPAELKKLAGEKKYFNEQVKLVELAKTWVSGGKLDKMAVAATIQKDRTTALRAVELCLKIIEATTNARTAGANSPQIRKLLRAYRQIEENRNIRLCLMSAII